MKKPTIHLLLLLSIVCVLTLIAGACGLASEGLQHIEPARAVRQARQDSQGRWFGASLGGYVRAYVMAVEAGARWTAARLYIDQMTAEREAGRLDQALSTCSRAVAILHGYDDEGSLSRECFAVEAEIKRQGAGPP